LQAIVEAFTSMQDDLNAEKRALQKQWAKRETQLDRLVNSTVGMYGDLQGIAGRSLEEIEGLSVPALAAPTADTTAKGSEALVECRRLIVGCSQTHRTGPVMATTAP
jgi:hypothetical protein